MSTSLKIPRAHAGDQVVTNAGTFTPPTPYGGLILPISDVELVAGVSTGGLSGGDSLLSVPIFDLDHGTYRPGTLNFNTFDDSNDFYSVQFRTEDVPEGRSATVSNIAITYRNLGPVKVTCTLTGAAQQVSSTLTFGSLDKSGNFNEQLMQVIVNDDNGSPLCLTDTLIFLTITKLGGDGNLDLVKVKLICQWPDDSLF